MDFSKIKKDVRNVSVGIRITQKEKEKINHICAMYNLSISQFVIYCINHTIEEMKAEKDR